MKPKITRATGTVVLRTKAKPKPCTFDWPKGDELDALMRKWNMNIWGVGQHPYKWWRACTLASPGYPRYQEKEGRTPLSAARKLARRLEKEAKR